MAQNAQFGESTGHYGIRWATDHIAVLYSQDFMSPWSFRVRRSGRTSVIQWSIIARRRSRRSAVRTGVQGQHPAPAGACRARGVGLDGERGIARPGAAGEPQVRASGPPGHGPGDRGGVIARRRDRRDHVVRSPPCGTPGWLLPGPFRARSGRGWPVDWRHRGRRPADRELQGADKRAGIEAVRAELDRLTSRQRLQAGRQVGGAGHAGPIHQDRDDADTAGYCLPAVNGRFSREGRRRDRPRRTPPPGRSGQRSARPARARGPGAGGSGPGR